MITIILLSIIIAILYEVVWSDKYLDNGSKIFMSFLLSTTLCAVAGLIVFGILGIFDSAAVEHSRNNKECNIYSIHNDNTIQGSFCLGSVTISGVENYYTFSKDNRGGLQRVTLNVNNCFLFQDDNKRPHISWQTITYRPSKWVYVGPTNEWNSDTKYDIHIPENSVIQKFEVK